MCSQCDNVYISIAVKICDYFLEMVKVFLLFPHLLNDYWVIDVMNDYRMLY